MKIAVVADKKAGHLSQCLGLREILKSYNKDKDLFLLNKDIIAFPGFLERAFTLIYEKLYLFILKLLNPSLVDRDFDLVICSEVLEHLDDYHAAIDEIFRVLKPEGKFLPSVPSYWPEKICWSLSTGYQNMPGGHVRIFKKRQLINEILDHGFKYDHAERFHGLHSAYWWLRCIFWKTQDSNYLVKIYKKFLEYQILQSPAWLNNLEKILNPIFGKSIAFYFEKK